MSIETLPPKAWADFLTHASKISHIPITQNYEIIGSKIWRFRSEFYDGRFVLQFICRSDPADRNSDFILINWGKLPIPVQISSWRIQFNYAVNKGVMTDFRAITQLTAILNFKP